MYAYISTPGFWARKLFLSLSLSRVSRRRARFVVDRAPRADSRIARVSSRAMSRRRVGEKTLELTVDMFRNTSRASTSASAYARAKTLVDDGVIAKPSWYDAASAVRPSPRPMKAPKPPPIAFPEDGLIRGFYTRNPRGVRGDRLSRRRRVGRKNSVALRAEFCVASVGNHARAKDERTRGVERDGGGAGRGAERSRRRQRG